MKRNRLFLNALCLVGSLSVLGPQLHAEQPTEALRQRQEKILHVVDQSGKAVVGISAIGSGVIINKEGLILTAAHVMDAMRTMMREEKEFTVILADGREVKAKPLGSNRNRDAAMAQITTPGEYPFANLGDPAAIKQGQWCVAMGHPGGFQVDRTPPVRVGRLWEKKDDAYFRSDCTVSGGDSGGPLFDLEGRVIGIHSSIGERLEENRHVPVSAFKESWDRIQNGEIWGRLSKLMPELAPFDRGHGPKEGQDKDDDSESAKPKEKAAPEPKSKEAPSAPSTGRPRLGVVVEGTGKGTVTIKEVSADSPAGKAGLQVDDVILKIDGEPMHNSYDVAESVRKHKAGDTLKLSITRNKESKDVDVVLENP